QVGFAFFLLPFSFCHFCFYLVFPVASAASSWHNKAILIGAFAARFIAVFIITARWRQRRASRTVYGIGGPIFAFARPSLRDAGKAGDRSAGSKAFLLDSHGGDAGRRHWHDSSFRVLKDR